ncbi:hypothetical protein [Azohydromonas aeria]|uniref:hypothetical protein n=1 Tax=Azohydromonas aeria TaxID=2590212 RepID=UPI0012F8FFFE|nr:hypothetical protein [Azohydromonas aeria]
MADATLPQQLRAAADRLEALEREELLASEVLADAEAQNRELNELRSALLALHSLAGKYLALTGGGMSDGSEAEAVERAGRLLGLAQDGDGDAQKSSPLATEQTTAGCEEAAPAP